MSEWRETTLSEIIELIGGGTPKTKIPEYWNGDIPWLSVVDFNTGRKFVFLKYRTGEILQLDIGGVQPSIKVPHLLSLIIPIPPTNIQKNLMIKLLSLRQKWKEIPNKYAP